jgi:hypothetical protein
MSPACSGFLLRRRAKTQPINAPESSVKIIPGHNPGGWY